MLIDWNHKCIRTKLCVSKQVTVDFRDPNIHPAFLFCYLNRLLLTTQKVQANCLYNSREKVYSPTSK